MKSNVRMDAKTKILIVLVLAMILVIWQMSFPGKIIALDLSGGYGM